MTVVHEPVTGVLGDLVAGRAIGHPENLTEPTPVTIARKPRRLHGITESGPELLPLEAGEQYRFSFSMDACIGCHSCEVACAEQNNLPVGTTWRRVGEVEGGAFPETKRFHLSMACNHCVEPACLIGCPTEAYVKLDNGIVKHLADECIGCQYCTWNCPYSVPAFQPDRRIVSKCDMCQPRLESGLTSACVDACPTHAIGIEKMNVADWLADHHEGDAPNLPSVELTLSTTRIILPADMPMETYAGSDWNLRPEHPHWPLVWLTLLTQAAVGTSVISAFSDPSLNQRLLAAVLAGVALQASLFHLGRPAMALKALRNLRRSWLSREVLAFGVYAGLAALAVVVPVLAGVAGAAGVAGVYASGRLYVVPGRPSWNSPLTIIRFMLTAVILGGLVAGSPEVAVAGLGLQLAAEGANLARLGRSPKLEHWGTARLTFRWFGWLTSARVGAAVVASALALTGLIGPAIVVAALGELAGRYLFYVTVVPLNMPGTFFKGKLH
jgi:DMSO reductase iron-sulfur subunit